MNPDEELTVVAGQGFGTLTQELLDGLDVDKFVGGMGHVSGGRFSGSLMLVPTFGQFFG